jgi:LysR family nitrogen assimilation transcriptional regulator
MELRQLKYFMRIVELGSVSRASKDLFIAQPALSQQIANLEAELGVRLLSRTVRGVTSTEAGQTFYHHAQTVLRQIERLKSDVTDTGANPRGLVSIGMPTSAANILAAPLIAAAHDRFPEIQLQIVESLSGHLEELVANGRIEICLLFDRAPSVDETPMVGEGRAVNLHVTPLLDEELFLFTADAGTVAETSVTLAEAARYRFLLPGRANLTRRMIDKTFQTKGHQLELLAELDSLSAIKTVVSSGLGATILSTAALSGEPHESGLVAQSISDAVLRRRLSLCTYDIVALGAAADCIVKLIPELVHVLISSGRWKGAYLLESTKIKKG